MSSTKAIICSTPPTSGFAASLSGREMAELRRWIRGPEGRARTRMRGLEERLKDLIADDEAAQGAMEEAVQAASALAGEGWTQRLGTNPRGPGEVFLAAAYPHVRARSQDRGFLFAGSRAAALGRRTC